MALGVFIGIYTGRKMDPSPGSGKQNVMEEALQYISNEYVDTVNTRDLQQNGIEAMLEKLDPHSSFVPAKDLQVVNSSLEASFDGIGIEFQIFNDTVNVITPIPGGPSELGGLQPGDKIINVDDKLFAGTKITINDVFGKLRGKKGSKVKLGIRRKGIKKLMNFTIVRDAIPTYSVEAAFMYAPETGYIKLVRFGEETFPEFKAALEKLKNKGMKRLVLDLRDNHGGFLDHATNITDEFLSGNKLIVYTKGKKSQYSNTFNSEHEGNFEEGALIVLIDEGSASASEIVSGALQDHDRAILVGRRSFGKGLVQMPINLSDGSQMRLTISRYYTPSGRSIQKPYNGNREDYEMESINRFKNGEMYSKDSVHFADSLKFKTDNGRTVYGGGGIMPDVFVAQDTTAYSSYLSLLLNKGVLRESAYELYNDNKEKITKMTMESFNKNFRVSEDDLNKMVNKASGLGIQFNEKGFARSKEYIRNYVKALIAKSAWRMEGFFFVFNQKDNVFMEAQKHWAEAERISQ